MSNVIFVAVNKSFAISSHQTILQCAMENDVDLDFGCGSTRCGICVIHIESLNQPTVLSKLSEREKKVLEGLNLAQKSSGVYRLACTARVLEGSIRVTKASL